jgi:lysophospholipase L1-like esterase
MLAPRALLASALLLLALPVVAQAQDQPAGAVFRVVAMGDSLTDTRVGGGKFLSYLAKKCPQSRFESKGKGGQMVNQMRKRFARDVLGKGYTHVLIMGGVNDLYSDKTAGRTVAKIQSDLAAMYAAARAQGMKVIALTVAPWGGFSHHTPARAVTTRQLNSWIMSQQTEGAVDAAVDTGPVLSCGDPERLCEGLGRKDGLHWAPAGHEKLGEALFARVFSGCR